MDVNGNGQIGNEQFLEVFNIALREQMDVLLQGTMQQLQPQIQHTISSLVPQVS